jgi:hypothetical protein
MAKSLEGKSSLSGTSDSKEMATLLVIHLETIQKETNTVSDLNNLASRGSSGEFPREWRRSIGLFGS